MAAQTVGTDPSGDWGGGGNAGLVGHALGQDLTKATIAMPNADTVAFTMEVTFLPTGPNLSGMPEASRYTWDMLVDGEFVELDGKFTNYSRGACDPTSGQCDPAAGRLPRDPGPAPFSRACAGQIARRGRQGEWICPPSSRARGWPRPSVSIATTLTK
ncbi:hypothetical protein BH23ACT9_BH23ACT9_11830 [soil metagenome]